MYCSTIIAIKSQQFVDIFIALLAAKCCYGRQVNKRQATNAVPLLSTIGNVVLEKMFEVFGGPDTARSFATPDLYPWYTFCKWPIVNKPIQRMAYRRPGSTALQH